LTGFENLSRLIFKNHFASNVAPNCTSKPAASVISPVASKVTFAPLATTMFPSSVFGLTS